MGLNPKADRGKTRQFAAQIAILFLTRRERGNDTFVDINASAINDFYFSHIDFDKNSSDAKRLNDILSTLDRLLGTGKRPRLKAHDAIHLVLLAESLWDDYVRSWEAKLPAALDRFMENFARSKREKDSAHPDEFWRRYGQWTRVNSDRGDTIARRHAFYTEKMFEYLAPLQLKDPKRTFGELEREIAYFQAHKLCAVCESEVSWDLAEVHHVIEHSKGGGTVLENAALVHVACHPKGEAATKAFEQKFLAAKARPTQPRKAAVDADTVGYLWKNKDADLFLPDGTQLRMPYKQKDYFAKVVGDQIMYEGKAFSPSNLVNEITGTSRNAWRDLWIKFPGDSDWKLADELRSDALESEAS